MMVQLIAIDGVAVHLPQDTPMGSMVRMAGGKFRVVPCPAAQMIGNSVPVCVNEIVMMPSSRVEMWVTYRDQNGRIVTPPRGASATLEEWPLTMGSGDTWPAVDLAKVLFNQSTGRQFTSNQVVVNDSGALQPGGILVAAGSGATASPLPPGCAALPAGHRRRIFFGFADVFDRERDLRARLRGGRPERQSRFPARRSPGRTSWSNSIRRTPRSACRSGPDRRR